MRQVRRYAFGHWRWHRTSLAAAAASSSFEYHLSAHHHPTSSTRRSAMKVQTPLRMMSTLFCFPAAAQALAQATNQHQYDLVIVGGGSAGLTAAKLAGGTMKKSVVIIEQDKLGGDCTWTGCIPSKSLLASAKAAHLARKQAISGNGPPVNFAAIQQRYRTNMQEIYEEDDSPQALAKFNVETISGKALLISQTSVQVTSNEKEFVVSAKEGIVLCTGASPRAPTNIPGLQDVDYITYEQVWNLKELPKRLTVVGGGPIGCELAQAFARLGSQVTIIADRLLPREEPEVSVILQEVFEEEGIQILKGKVSQVTKNADGSHTATASSSGESTTGDVLLLSVGRTPNVKGLGLETVGVDTNHDKGGIAVNDKLQTSVKGIYAAGDCTGDRQFTHYAGFQGAIAARNILLPLTDPGVLSEVPACTFTSPEVASVGYTEAEARKEFGDNAVAVSSMRLDQVDRAICDGETKGILKVVYKKRNGIILGATMMCPAGGELISEISVAMKAGMPFDGLAKVIHPYPSYAIALQLMAADVYYEKTMKLRPVYDFLKRIGL